MPVNVSNWHQKLTFLPKRFEMFLAAYHKPIFRSSLAGASSLLFPFTCSFYSIERPNFNIRWSVDSLQDMFQWTDRCRLDINNSKNSPLKQQARYSYTITRGTMNNLYQSRALLCFIPKGIGCYLGLFTIPLKVISSPVDGFLFQCGHVECKIGDESYPESCERGRRLHSVCFLKYYVSLICTCH